MIQISLFYLRNCTPSSGHSTPLGFNIKLPLSLGFESGFTGFLGLDITSLVRVLSLFVDGYCHLGSESGFTGFRGLERTSLVQA